MIGMLCAWALSLRVAERSQLTGQHSGRAIRAGGVRAYAQE